MPRSEYPAQDWKKLRFKWKECLIASQDVTRGAKQLGVLVCDKYADRRSGLCWPSNKTLAKALCVTDRTVQRYVAELTGFGWLNYALIPRRRRGLALSFPQPRHHDNEGDSEDDMRVTEMSPKHDKTVGAYNRKEPSQNQKEEKAPVRPLSFRPVSAQDVSCIGAWKEWISENMEHDPDALFEKLQRNGNYFLPSMRPTPDEQQWGAYRTYFELVEETNGACLGI